MFALYTTETGRTPLLITADLLALQAALRVLTERGFHALVVMP